MCFSFQADLVAGAVLLPLGIATLRAAKEPRELPLASLPLVFAAHQLIESVVWLGTGDKVSEQTFHAATVIYLAIAQVLLPALVPIAMWLVEPRADRRRLMLVTAAFGLGTAAWFAWSLFTHDVGAHPVRNTMVYDTDIHIGPWITATYVIATCGSVLLSSRRYLLAFGIANVVGLSIAAIVRYEAVTSVWCVYAAFASVLLLLHFRAEHAADDDGAATRRSASREPQSATG